MTELDGYIINPKTNRLIKIGSKLYNKLVVDGFLTLNKENHKDKVVFELEKDSNIKEIKNKLKEENNDKNITFALGKGVYKNKIVKINKKKNKKELLTLISNIIYEIINDNNLYYELKNKDYDEIEYYINKHFINKI